MSEQWEEVKIEDVQPGDVARCNGREFRVMETGEGSRRKWYVTLGSYQMANYDLSTIGALGITFHRKVKREPRTVEGTVQLGGAGTCGVICVSREYVGARFLLTEIIDGEDGA